MRVVIRVAIPERFQLEAGTREWHEWSSGVVRGMVEQAGRFGDIGHAWTLSMTDDLGKELTDGATWLQGDFKVVAS